MSPRTNAPATPPAGTGPSDAPTDARDADDDACDAECDAGLRTATRLLRLLKLASGVLVSVLTALKLLGVI